MSGSQVSRFDIEVSRDIEVLEREWRALEANGRCTAFQRYDFVAPLYAAFRTHKRAAPLIVAVREKSSGNIVMILPLCETKIGRERVIAFADLRVADYCAPLMAQDFHLDAVAFRALWKAIENALPPSDLLRLSKLPERVGNDPNPLLLISPCAPYHVKAHGAALAQPWPECCQALLSRKQRQSLRRKGRNLESCGEVTFTLHERGSEAEHLFETLYTMRRARFDQLEREDALADEMWADFYRDLVRGNTATPFARLIELKSGSETVACALGLIHDNAYLLLIPSFDVERFGRYSPGMLLIFRGMEVFTEAGFTYFDLTIGDEPYKDLFGVDHRELYEVVRPLSARGYLAAAIWRLKVALRRNPTLHKHLKRLLRR